jgi:hypothetical protein
MTLIDGTTLDGMGGFSGGFQLANGLIYGSGGGIANPSTTPSSQIATLSFDNFGVNPPVVVMMLLRGPFVAPQELGASSAASLTSSSATTITHGSGNTMLTLTGSNFLPGVAVTWNGSYRTTTIVDATHVTVAIPASDLTSTGTAMVVATNPGASTSNALQITIN